MTKCPEADVIGSRPASSVPSLHALQEAGCPSPVFQRFRNGNHVGEMEVEVPSVCSMMGLAHSVVRPEAEESVCLMVR
ncbi:4-hydroxythreonine-4-phosphate dehydrogenase 2 [Desmospora sp. 8437]|nr:4-hydroxythreonine-4-phosphate dehydrogenase 2 [Desmospora sp. 8437]